MDIFGGEYLDDFVQHVLHKLERFLLARAEHVREYAPGVFHLIRAARAAQLRIGSQRSEHVARHVDFGNHGNKSIGGIFYDFTALLLCVEAAVTLAVVEAGVTSDDCAGAPGTLRGQLGVFLDFNAPALVFGDVPVEAVHAMQGNQVDVLLHELQGEEMACAVEVHATIAEARLVDNGDCGQAHGLWPLGEYGQRLAQRLDATEHASRGLSADGDAFG